MLRFNRRGCIRRWFQVDFSFGLCSKVSLCFAKCVCEAEKSRRKDEVDFIPGPETGRCSLTGFEAIAHHNGWVMAAFGAAIVFCGLAVLAFVISLLPKVFALFEKGTAEPAVKIAPETSKPEASPPPPTEALRNDLESLAKLVEPLAAELTAPFQLADLYNRCRERDLPHPHLTLSSLQQKGYLVFQGEGAFTWKSEPSKAQEG